MTIGWAILGTGRHPDNRVAPAIQKAADSRLVAVLSRDREKGQAFAAKHGGLRSYDSLAELLRDPEVNAVFVATPNSLHAQQTIAAARVGKHVLCEKPMALTVQDCQGMIDACRQNGVKLGIGFHLRHHQAHIEARRLVATGAIGTLAEARCQFLSLSRSSPVSWWTEPTMVGGGAIMGNGVHSMDILRFVSGREVEEVMAFSDGQRPQKPIEDQLVALLRFEGNIFAILESNRLKLLYPDGDLILYGSQGTIKCLGTVSSTGTGHLKVATETYASDIEFQAQDLYQSEIESFVRAIKTDGEPDASGLDGLRTTEITVAILESAKQGKAVKIHRT